MNTQTIQEPGMKIPLLVHTAIPGQPNEDTLTAAKRLAGDERLFHHVALLSEAFKKPGIANPAGGIAASATHIIPQLMDAAPNCGMRLMATDLTDDEVADLDRLFAAIRQAVPTKKYVTKPLPQSVVSQSFIGGSRPVAEHLNTRVVDELKQTQDQGDLFDGKGPSVEELKKLVPPGVLRAARLRLGIMGATGSHFLSLVKADKLLSQPGAAKLGISQGQYLFYLHTGSGIIGRYIAYLYSPQKRRLSHQLGLNVFGLGWRSPVTNELRAKTPNLLGFEASSSAGQAAAQALMAAGNQGFANRTVLSHNLDQALERAVGRPVKLRLVYDAPHVFLAHEQHYGQAVWVHRNGATRARKGDPALIAPFENSFGYAGIGAGQATTFASANHEIGKTAGTSNQAYTKVGEYGGQLEPTVKYTEKGRQEMMPESRHAALATAVAREIEGNQIMKLAVRLRPIGTLTYHRK